MKMDVEVVNADQHLIRFAAEGLPPLQLLPATAEQLRGGRCPDDLLAFPYRGVMRARFHFWVDVCTNLKNFGNYNQSEFDKIQHLMLQLPTLELTFKESVCLRHFEPLAQGVFSIYQLYLILADYPEMDAYVHLEQLLQTKNLIGVNFFLNLYQQLDAENNLDVMQVLYCIRTNKELKNLYKSAQTEAEYDALSARIDTELKRMEADDKDDNNDAVSMSISQISRSSLSSSPFSFFHAQPTDADIAPADPILELEPANSSPNTADSASTISVCTLF